MWTKKTGIKDDGGMIVGENDRGKIKKVDPKAAVLEMLRESEDQQEPNELKGKWSLKEKRDEKKEQINLESIRTALLRRLQGKEVSLFQTKASCDVLFHNLEDELGLTRNRLREKDVEKFVLKSMFDYYKAQT